MQYVTECFVFNGGEEPEIAIRHPFDLGDLSMPFDKNGVNQRIAANPFERKAMFAQEIAVPFRRLCDAFLAIVKDIDIRGVSRRISR